MSVHERKNISFGSREKESFFEEEPYVKRANLTTDPLTY